VSIRNSEHRLFKRCRRHWYLSYFRGLERNPREREEWEAPSTTDTGTEVHRMLQAHYTGQPHEDGSDDLANIMFAGYLEWLEETGEDVGLTTVAAERPVEATITDLRGRATTITGKIDLMQHDEAFGGNVLVDHKTVSSMDQAGQQLKVDDQLLTYALILHLNGEPITGAFHNMLRRVKRTARATPPFYGRRRVAYNDTQLMNHLTHLQATLTDLNDGRENLGNGWSHQLVAPPTPTKDCTWDCPFLAVCPMMDDGSDAEGMLAANYRLKEDV
jgi:RecB family exonuclease